jgi:hypothetical protein
MHMAEAAQFQPTILKLGATLDRRADACRFLISAFSRRAILTGIPHPYALEAKHLSSFRPESGFLFSLPATGATDANLESSGTL